MENRVSQAPKGASSAHSTPNRWEIARRVALVVTGLVVAIGIAAAVTGFFYPLGSIVLFAAYGGGGAAFLACYGLALSYCCCSCRRPPVDMPPSRPPPDHRSSIHIDVNIPTPPPSPRDFTRPDVEEEEGGDLRSSVDDLPSTTSATPTESSDSESELERSNPMEEISGGESEEGESEVDEEEEAHGHAPSPPSPAQSRKSDESESDSRESVNLPSTPEIIDSESEEVDDGGEDRSSSSSVSEGVVQDPPSPPLPSPPASPPPGFEDANHLQDSMLDSWIDDIDGRALSPSYTPPARSWLETIVGLGNCFGDLLKGPGPIQQRTYHYLLAGVVDGLIMYFDGRPNGTSIGSRVEMVNDHVERKIPSLKVKMDGPKQVYTSEFNYHLYSLLQTLYKFPSSSDVANLRYTFFYHLNQAYELKGYAGDEEKGLLEEIGYLIYTGVSMQSYGQNLLFQEINLAPRSALPLSALLRLDRDSIEERASALRASPAFTKLAQANGELAIAFSPDESNNFGSTLYQTIYSSSDESRRVQTIRYGTPTAQSAACDPLAIPSFRLFLEGCLKRGQKIVALQHQSPFKSKERARLDIMDQLGRDYPETFFVFRFPLDGDFFNSKSADSRSVFVQHLKDRLVDSCMRDEPQSGLQLPNFKLLARYGPEGFFDIPRREYPAPQVHTSPFGDEVNAIINDINSLYFSTGELSAEKRKIFQLLTYAHLDEYFSLFLGADFRSSQCKDTLDRSMLVNVLGYYLHLIRTGQEKDPAQINHIRTMVNGYGLMIKDIPMHGGRFDLLCAALDHLENLPEEKKAAICARKIRVAGKEWTLDKTVFETTPHQDYAQLPSEATSMEAYCKSIEREKGVYHYHLPHFLQNFERDPLDDSQVGRDLVNGGFEVNLDGKTLKFTPPTDLVAMQQQTTEQTGILPEKALQLLRLSTQATIYEINKVVAARYENSNLEIRVRGGKVQFDWVTKAAEDGYEVEGNTVFRITGFDGSGDPVDHGLVEGKIHIDLKTGEAVVSWKASSKT